MVSKVARPSSEVQAPRSKLRGPSAEVQAPRSKRRGPSSEVQWWLRACGVSPAGAGGEVGGCCRGRREGGGGGRVEGIWEGVALKRWGK